MQSTIPNLKQVYRQNSKNQPKSVNMLNVFVLIAWRVLRKRNKAFDQTSWTNKSENQAKQKDHTSNNQSKAHKLYNDSEKWRIIWTSRQFFVPQMLQASCVDVGRVENAARPRPITGNTIFVRRPEILKNPGKRNIREYADLVDFGSRPFWSENNNLK